MDKMAAVSKYFSIFSRRFLPANNCMISQGKPIFVVEKIIGHNYTDTKLNRKFMSANTNHQDYKKLHISQTNLKAADKVPPIIQRSGWNIVYQSPLSETLMKLKLMTVLPFNTLLLYPIYLLFTDDTLTSTSKLVIGCTCVLGYATSSYLYHWISRVYVRTMYFNPKSLKFAVETSSYGRQPLRDEFHIKDVILVDSLGSNFRTREKKYYIFDKMVEAQQILKFIHDWKEANDDEGYVN